MIKAFYYRAEDRTGELCLLDKTVVDRDKVCGHCREKIPAGSPAISLRTTDDRFMVHLDCALNNCNIRYAERGMRRRLIDFLERKHEGNG